MDSQTEQRIKELEMQVKMLMEYKEARERQQISYPVDAASRIAMGVGISGRTTDTTPAGSILVNTNQGVVKILVA